MPRIDLEGDDAGGLLARCEFDGCQTQPSHHNKKPGWHRSKRNFIPTQQQILFKMQIGAFTSG